MWPIVFSIVRRRSKRKFAKKSAGGIRKNNFSRPAGFGKIISAGRRDSEDNFFGRPAGFGRQFSGEWFRPVGGIRKTIFGRNERSVAQIKVQVMTINSVRVSSKSELSSGVNVRSKFDIKKRYVKEEICIPRGHYEMDSGPYFLRFLKTYTDTVPSSKLLKEPQMHEAVKILVDL